jgi:hypothetical protein
VAAFFNQENYATLIREIDSGLGLNDTEPPFMPCLIYHDQIGADHVLWGATFFLIISFLEIVFNFELPEWRNKRVVKKTIDARYLSGKGNPRP